MAFDALRIGASGLAVAQRAVEVASNNVANVNTDGYTRQRVDIVNARPTPGTPGVRGDGMRGTGATIGGLERMRDVLADLGYRAAASAGGQAQATSDILDRTVNLLGSLDQGAPASMNAFFAAWNQLSITPTDAAARNGVIAAGSALAADLRTVAQGIAQVTPDTQTKMTDLVTEANGLLSHVADLNKGIADAVATGQQPSDLMDERDRALDSLSGLLGVTTNSNPDGRVDVFLGGQPLVRGEKAQALALTLPPAAPQVTLAATGQVLPAGGQLGGYAQAVTTTLPGLMAQLNSVAAGLITAVNAAHEGGFDATGAPGGAFFTGTGAQNIDVDPTLTADKVAAGATASPSDGNNALTLAGVATQPAVGASTVGDALRAFLGAIGQQASVADTKASTTATVLAGASSRRLSSTSVNVDEEMVDMLRYQRAYQASARAVSTADAMLDTLINHTGN